MLESEVTGLEKTEVIVIKRGVGEAEVEMVPAEQEFVFAVNGTYEARFCCTPHRVRALAVGWLAGEGIIERAEEFIALEIDFRANRVDIIVSAECLRRLAARITPGAKPVLGEMPVERRVDTSLELAPDAVDALAEKFRKLFLSLRSSERMCYLCSLADGNDIVTYGEGFHRINAMFRALGELLLHGKSVEGKIALMNYGLSRTHVAKLARAGIALAICLAAPTTSAITLANDYYLCIVHAGMGRGVRVYSAPWRVV